MKTNESFRSGAIIADDSMEGVELTPVGIPDLRNDGRGHRRGTLDNVEEGDDSASSIHADDQEQTDAMLEDYKNKIKSAVSARLLGKKINLKLSGNKRLIKQIVSLIKLESDYLQNIMGGQGADAPILMKTKAQIEVEANVLDRMLGTTDFWPFK
jgi:hypothetical protein